MDFIYNAKEANEKFTCYPIGNREESILNFQNRIYDLIFLNSTPIVEKINFISIIKSNLKEFIEVRLNDIYSSHLRNNLAIIIQDMFSILGRTLDALNKKYGISAIPVEDEAYEIIEHTNFNVIYGEENDYELYKKMAKIKFELGKDSSYSILYNKKEKDFLPYPERQIQIPENLFVINEYKEAYKEKFPNEVFDRSTKHYGIKNYYEYLKEKDLLIRTPYEAYDHVVEFIQEMCNHPKIKVIFVTLYRISDDSKIIKALIDAKENGKQVFVYVEPCARGDEKNNLKQIQILLNHNIFVRSSYFSFKVHSKVFLAIGDDFTKFAHIGTGNYNEKTAKLYTDFHLLTSNKEITNELLNILISLFEKKIYSKGNISLPAVSSPFNFREKMIHLIRREERKGIDGRIWIKCNNLCDKDIIKCLYKAGENGVDIKIICRTGCSIYPKENIEIRSKVGMYLEHERVYIFGDESYISSADLLFRNISKRLELLVKINHPKLIETFKNIWNQKIIHCMDEIGSWGLK